MKIRKWLSIASVFLLIALLGVSVDFSPDKDGKRVITLGHVAYAAGDLDYTFDGVADDVQFQAALNALPATGGELVVVSATTINFSATVTRAIDNVTITGSGRGTYFANDGVTDLFTAGGNNWTFRDLRTDAGGIGMGATTGWSWENVTINATYYAYRTDDATTAASWNIPTGRGATYVVAASNAPAHVKAQADYVCDGTADQTEINAAITAAGAGGVVELVGIYDPVNGDFVISGTIACNQASATLKGHVVIITAANQNYNAVTVSALRVTIDGIYFKAGATPASGSGLYANTVPLYGMTLTNNRFFGFKNNGAYITGVANPYIVGNQFTSNSDEGLYIVASGDGTLNGWINDNYFASNGKRGARVDGAQDLNMSDNFYISNTLDGLYSANNTNSRFTGVSDGNGDNGVQSVSCSKCYYEFQCWNNSQTTTNTKDGFQFANGNSYNTIRITAVSTAAKVHAYGINERGFADNVYNVAICPVTTGNTVGITVSGASANPMKVVQSVGQSLFANSGTATVVNGTTSIVVNHGLAGTPTRVQITLTNNPTNDPQVWWVDTLTATQFTINTKVDPGATGAIFNWRAVIGEGN